MHPQVKELLKVTYLAIIIKSDLGTPEEFYNDKPQRTLGRHKVHKEKRLQINKFSIFAAAWGISSVG